MEMDTKQAPILEVSCERTFRDFLEAARTYSMTSSRSRRFRYRIYVKYGYLTATSFILIGIAGLFAGDTPGWLGQGLAGTVWPYVSIIFPCFIGIGIVVLLNPSRYKRRCRNSFRQYQVGTTMTAKFFDDGVFVARRNDAVQTSFDWVAISSWAESAGVFILLLSAAQFLWLPKRVLSTEQQHVLRELLAAKIPVKREA